MSVLRYLSNRSSFISNAPRWGECFEYLPVPERSFLSSNAVRWGEIAVSQSQKYLSFHSVLYDSIFVLDDHSPIKTGFKLEANMPKVVISLLLK